MNLGDVGLIDGASNIVNQGCATCHAHATQERRDNFEKVINKMRKANLFEGIGNMNAQFDDEQNCIYDCMSDVDNTQLRIAQCATCEDPAVTCYVPGWSIPCWAAQTVQSCLDMDGLDCTNLPDITEITNVMGCTDSSANNYDAEANDDDGSCAYDVVEPDMCNKCIKKAKKVLGCERVLELAANGIPSKMQQKIEKAGCLSCVDSVIADCETSTERRKL